MPALEAATRGGAAPRARSRQTRRLLENVEAWTFLLPATVVLAIFHFFPIVFAFYVSLLRWNMIDPVRPFVGAGNYARLLQDEKFVTALGNTTYYAVASVGIAIPLALFFAPCPGFGSWWTRMMVRCRDLSAFISGATWVLAFSLKGSPLRA